jgi:hypothetical protein
MTIFLLANLMVHFFLDISRSGDGILNKSLYLRSLQQPTHITPHIFPCNVPDGKYTQLFSLVGIAKESSLPFPFPTTHRARLAGRKKLATLEGISQIDRQYVAITKGEILRAYQA